MIGLELEGVFDSINIDPEVLFEASLQDLTRL